MLFATANQVRAARGLVGWTQQQLATEARVGKNSLSRFEAGAADSRMSTILAVTAALEKAGVIFIPDTLDEGEGVRFRKPASARTRADAHAGDAKESAGTMKPGKKRTQRRR
jgi:transcriptional regulator with XRE-family HTH domain